MLSRSNSVGQAFAEWLVLAAMNGARYQPQMHDLTHTFAVHRLTAWIKRDADLNRMLPALSAYIGASAQRIAICL
jgi:hypothetical protein